jgi:hypothetical protein
MDTPLDKIVRKGAMVLAALELLEFPGMVNASDFWLGEDTLFKLGSPCDHIEESASAISIIFICKSDKNDTKGSCLDTKKYGARPACHAVVLYRRTTGFNQSCSLTSPS